jgi:hypothetical protein
MVIVKESYAAYENKVEEPNQDGQGNMGLLDATATKWKNDAVNKMFQFFKMQLFRAALPGYLRKAVTQLGRHVPGGDRHSKRIQNQSDSTSDSHQQPLRSQGRRRRGRRFPKRTE